MIIFSIYASIITVLYLGLSTALISRVILSTVLGRMAPSWSCPLFSWASSETTPRRRPSSSTAISMVQKPTSTSFLVLIYFFAKSVRIELALPQAAWLSIFLIVKSVVLVYERCITQRIEEIRKKPIIRRDSNPRHQQICSAGVCSTAVLQPIPIVISYLCWAMEVA